MKILLDPFVIRKKNIFILKVNLIVWNFIMDYQNNGIEPPKISEKKLCLYFFKFLFEI